MFKYSSTNHQTNFAAIDTALAQIGGKYKCQILARLLAGERRFNQLKRDLGDITQRTLVKQLRELEADQIVARIVLQEMPPKVEYQLTEKGQSLETLLMAMRYWGERYRQD